MLIKPFLIVLVVIILYIAITGVRSFAFLSMTKKLSATAQRFPTEYTVGTGTDPAIYTILGDSTALGVGLDSIDKTLGYTLATASGNAATVHVYAVSGAVLQDVVTQQLPLLKAPLGTVLVSISANDATHFTPAADFTQNLTNLLDELTKAGASKILLTTTPSFSSTPALPGFYQYFVMRKSTELSGIITAQAARYPQVRIVDLHTKGELATSEYANDKFHPSAKGYAQWAQVVIEANQ